MASPCLRRNSAAASSDNPLDADFDLVASNAMTPEKSVFVSWEGRAALLSNVEAWACISGSWEPIDPLEVSDSGRVVSAEVFDALFPDLPELPAEAFASSSAAAP